MKLSLRIVSVALCMLFLSTMGAVLMTSAVDKNARSWVVDSQPSSTTTEAPSEPSEPSSESVPESESESQPVSQEEPPSHSVTSTEGEPEPEDEPDRTPATTGSVQRRTTSRAVTPTTTEDDGAITVSFNSNGGTAIEVQSLKDGDLVAQPATPQREGFEFAGWFKDALFTDAVDFTTDRVRGDVILYAKWVQLTDETLYTVTFAGAPGGTVQFNPASALAGEKITITVIPDEGKRLKDGTISLNGVLLNGLIFEMPANDVVVSVQFEDVPFSEENEREINRGVIAIVGVAFVVVITLCVIAFSMREKINDDDEPEWKDDSIVLKGVVANGGKIEAVIDTGEANSVPAVKTEPEPYDEPEEDSGDDWHEI